MLVMSFVREVRRVVSTCLSMGDRTSDDFVPAVGEPAESTLEIAQIERMSQKDDDLHAEKAPKGTLSALVLMQIWAVASKKWQCRDGLSLGGSLHQALRRVRRSPAVIGLCCNRDSASLLGAIGARQLLPTNLQSSAPLTNGDRIE